MERAIDRIEPFQRAIAKAHLASAGISIDALDHKPLIAVANSWNEICPGHEPLKQLAEEVKKGMLEAAKCLALCGIKVLEDDGTILREAKKEFDTMMGGRKYACPFPAELHPPR